MKLVLQSNGSGARRGLGFTLIELVIAVAIVGILAAIAIPSYKSSVQRGSRSAAQAEMLDIANRQEQYMLANRAYATKAVLVTNGYVLKTEVAAKYDWDAVPAAGTVPGFTITFTPKSTGAQRGDVTLTLNNNGTKTPADKW